MYGVRLTEFVELVMDHEDVDVVVDDDIIEDVDDDAALITEGLGLWKRTLCL